MKRIVTLWILALIGAPVVFSQGLLENALKGKATIIDLTHKLTVSMPYWPGETYTPFRFETIATLEKDGVYSGAFCMAEHMGTHVDAPNHFEAGQASIDALTLQQLIAPAAVIDVREQVAKDPDYRLTVDDLKRWEKKNGPLPANALVCLYTGWDSRWDDLMAYRHQDAQKVMHFPGFSSAVAEFLVNQRNIRGIGIDTLSVDYGPSKDFIVHHIMNRAGKYHLENIANLGKLPAQGAVVIAAPIPIQNGSGAPARVFALVPRSS